MRFASALTTKMVVAEAVEDLGRQVTAQLGPAKTDLAVMFVHPKFALQIDKLVESVQKMIGARHLIGCTGGGIIGVDQEVEQQPAISLLVGELPGVEFAPFHLDEKNLEEWTGADFWHFQLDLEPDVSPQFLMFVDPFTMHAVQLVDALTEAYPLAPIIGGLASGAQHAGENRLFLDGEIYDEGAMGIGLTGKIVLQTVVSQGCRPIGEPLVVTRAEKNVVFELGGRPPMKILQEMLPQLPAKDRQLARSGLLFLGRVINEYQDEYGRGDFLIRNLIESDRESGALSVADMMRTGQTVQFQVRDGETADEDLRQLLQKQQRTLAGKKSHAALLFT